MVMEVETRALPAWVEPLATVFVAPAVLTAAAVAYDIHGRGCRSCRRCTPPPVVRAVRSGRPSTRMAASSG